MTVDVFAAVAVASAVVAAGLLGFGLGYMRGHDAGWDEAARMPPDQLALAKRLLDGLRRRR